ncbi:MAG: alpha/beta fold hydrolase [Lentimicrobium sp.]|nr:alpha/beta fold hydrolase [Lentimicrobium sp.]
MKLFYRHFGEGQPLIILHGLFGVSDNWVTIGKKLAEKFSVFIPDQRNHGKSPHSVTFNYFALSDDLHEFIKEHKLEKIILIGHSMGGKVAMTFALEHPELVEKLVVVDISPRKYPGRNVHFEMISAMMAVDFDKVESRNDVERQLIESIPNKRIRMFVMKNLYRKTRQNFDWQINLEAISANLDFVFEGVESSDVYEGQTLFIRGGRSDYIEDIDLPVIRKLFPASEVLTIEKASHWVHADSPTELCRLFSNFLGKECVAPGAESE